METKVRHKTNNVVLHNRLTERAIAFSFMQMVRLLQRYTTNIEFNVNPNLAMPLAEIAELTITEHDSQQQKYRLLVNFLGLIGQDGIMPQHYKQLVLDRLQAKDSSLYDFLNIFHHQLLALYYQILAAKRFYINYESAKQDSSSKLIASVVGQSTDNNSALLYYAGLFSQQSRSPQGLKQFISDYFETAVEIYQYQPKWLALPDSQQTTIHHKQNTSNNILGQSALLGSNIWQVQNNFTLKLGPLSYAQYQQYLPDGEYYAIIMTMIKQYVGLEHDFILQLELKNNQIPTCELRYKKSLKLGWTSWLSQSKDIVQPGVSLCSN